MIVIPAHPAPPPHHTERSGFTIFDHFQHVDFPPHQHPPQFRLFAPGEDFWIVGGQPRLTGHFRGAFPFSRFPSLDSIRKRLTVNLVVDDTLELIQQTVSLSVIEINSAAARGCRLVTVTQRVISTGIFAVVEVEPVQLLSYGG